MKKIISLILISILLLSLCSCRVRESSGSFSAMDTYMNFKVYGVDADVITKNLKDEVRGLDSALSTTKSSDVSKLNSSGKGTLGEESLRLLNRSIELCGELDGALDISVYPIVDEWGFISRDYNVPDKKRIAELLKKVDYKKIKVNDSEVTLEDGMQLDFGAVAKGYAADVCREYLENDTAENAILDFGGTILTYGTKPDGSEWKVGIADPDNKQSYFGTIACHDTVVATSGGYERSFKKDGKRYIHIIDPKTGCPVDNGMKSVTVISTEGTRADALSTALYVMGTDKAVEYYREHKDFDLIMLTEGGRLYISEGIADSFKLADGYDYSKTVI